MVEYVQALMNLYIPRKAEGQGMVEYGLILVLVAIAAIVALTTLGGKLSPIFDKVSGSLNVT